MVTRAATRLTGLRERRRHSLAPWLADAEGRVLPELRRFAIGLRCDTAAVEAALALPYSNGQTEGRITALKLLQRTMSGFYRIRSDHQRK
jgi:transposase